MYYSNCKELGIVGVVKIGREAYPDTTAFDKRSKYYDLKTLPEKSRWFTVDIQFKKKFDRTVTLEELRNPPIKGYDYFA